MLETIRTRLAAVYGPGFEYRYIPPATDRAPWGSIPQPQRDNLVRLGIRWTGRAWPSLPASRYLDFYRDGNRSRFEQVFFERRQALMDMVRAEAIQGEGRLMHDICDLVWAMCEETTWVVPAHNSHDSKTLPRDLPPIDGFPFVDLFAAETAATLALTESVLRDSLDRQSLVFRKRIRHEISRRVWMPYLAHEDWGWMGLTHDRPVNNWNPWINSNVLVSVLALSTDSEERLAIADKVLRSTERFVAGYGPDGGCDEGPGYWNAAAASLFDILDLLEATSKGALSVAGDPLLAAMARFPMLTHLADGWFVNFADAPARINLDGELLVRFARMTKDGELESFARWAGEKPWGKVSSRWGHFQRSLANLFFIPAAPAPEHPPLVREARFPDLQAWVVRGGESSKGFTLAAKGGHNGESHNHNDVGHFILFHDGEPILVDAGVETYRKETFSADRYGIWTMQGAWHNLPVIGGIDQAPGENFRARDFSFSEEGTVKRLTLDIAGAYPEGSGIGQWKRTFSMDGHAGKVDVMESWSLSPDRAAQPTEIHFLSLPMPSVGENHVSFPTRHGKVVLTFDPLWKATTEPKPVTDPNLKKVWGDALYRTILSSTAIGAQGQGLFSFKFEAGKT